MTDTIITVGTLREYDVICGRIKLAYTHSGNKYFRYIINKYVIEYQNAPIRSIKNQICNTIIQTIHEKGGRFLSFQNNKILKSYNDSTPLIVTSKHYIYEKVSHALRSLNKDPEDKLSKKQIKVNNSHHQTKKKKKQKNQNRCDHFKTNEEKNDEEVEDVEKCYKTTTKEEEKYIKEEVKCNTSSNNKLYNNDDYTTTTTTMKLIQDYDKEINDIKITMQKNATELLLSDNNNNTVAASNIDNTLLLPSIIVSNNSNNCDGSSTNFCHHHHHHPEATITTTNCIQDFTQRLMEVDLSSRTNTIPPTYVPSYHHDNISFTSGGIFNTSLYNPSSIQETQEADIPPIVNNNSTYPEIMDHDAPILSSMYASSSSLYNQTFDDPLLMTCNLVSPPESPANMKPSVFKSKHNKYRNVVQQFQYSDLIKSMESIKHDNDTGTTNNITNYIEEKLVSASCYDDDNDDDYNNNDVVFSVEALDPDLCHEYFHSDIIEDDEYKYASKVE